MKNQVIEVLNEDHGKEVIKYFKALGFATEGFFGNCTRYTREGCRYYGVINGNFSNYSLRDIQISNTEIITLPDSSRYPKVMYVADSKKNLLRKKRRVVFMEKNGHYLAWANATSLKDAEKERIAQTWVYAIDITEESNETIIELTIKDISEGKGVGIAPHLIRIKE